MFFKSLQQVVIVLTQISTSLAQLVLIEQMRLNIEKQNVMTQQIVQALIAALVALTAQIKASAGDAAALKTSQDALAALQATDAALQDPALVKAANDAIAAAAAVEPPVNPVAVAAV